jgi:hypothetical protein
MSAPAPGPVWVKNSEYSYSAVWHGMALHLTYCGRPPRELTRPIEEVGWWSGRYRAVGMERSERIPAFYETDGLGRQVVRILGLAAAMAAAQEHAESV